MAVTVSEGYSAPAPFVVTTSRTVTSFTISFLISAAGWPVGSITFAGGTYFNGNTGTFASGPYPIQANVPSGYVFDSWVPSDGVAVADSGAFSTTATVTANGTVKAIFKWPVKLRGTVTRHINNPAPAWPVVEVRIKELLNDTTGTLKVGELVQVSRQLGFFEIKDEDYVEAYGLGYMLDGGHGVVMKRPDHYIKVASILDLSMSSGEVAVVQGGSGSNKVVVALMPQMVLDSISCSSGLPYGASCNFGDWSGKAGEFTRNLTIDTSLSTPTGSYTINVVGTAEGHTGTTTFTLRVDPLLPYPLTVALVALAAGIGSFTIGFVTKGGRKNEPTEPFSPPSSYQHEGFGFLTVSGRKAANEDSVLVSEVKSGSYLGTRRRTLFLIADGVGGREAGEMASLTACKIVAENLSAEFADASKPLNHLAVMTSAVLSANAQVLVLASSQPELQGMATTLTAALLDQSTLYIVHVGNCRAYLIRSGAITQLTQDHTYVQPLLDKGQISPEQARIHPRRNVITRAVGNREHLLVATYKYEVGRGDQLLLCTDGLSDYVSPGEALYVIQQARGNLQGACEALVDLALRKGSNDNISVIVATLRAPPPGMAYA